ncbi:MAG: DNA internalization-related competence protein ComEC/Rec2 [Thiohalophilus sp.]
MRSGTIAFLLGILCLQWFSDLPAPGWITLLLLSIPAALWLPLPWRLLGWGVSGFLWCLWSAHHILGVSLPADLEGRDIQVEGHVAGLPEMFKRRTRFEFDVDHLWVEGERRRWPTRIRLNWYGRSPPALEAGEAWRLQVRLKRPHGFRNPGGFDYERWLFARHLRASGYVRHEATAIERAAPLRYRLDRYRQRLSGRLQAYLQNPAAGLFLALTVGDRRAIDTETWEVLRVTGTAHLLAISGMHIGLLAALVFWLARRLWPLAGERALLWLPAPRAAALLATLAAAFYAALAGFAIPTQRALIMLLVVMLAVWRMRPLQPGRTLAWAALLVLLLDPLAVLSAGFWLSFAAVALILFALGGRRQRLSRAWQWLRIQGWITLGLAPLLILWFQQVSLIAPLANLVAIPLVSLLVVPLALLAVIGVLLAPDHTGALIDAVSGLLAGLLDLLDVLAAWPGSHWEIGVTGGVAVLLLAPGILVLLAPRGLPGRYLAPLLCLPLLLGAYARPPPGQAWLTLLDVGQGLAAAIQTHARVLVFDTGPRYSARFDTGAAVVVPYLRQAGYRRIDRLVISHGDNDHIGGLASVHQALAIGRIDTSVPGEIEGESVHRCQAGQHWRWDGVDFAFLGPAAGSRAGNDASCVLRIEAGGQVALLSGDIEQASERALVRRRRPELAAQILVAPHHGSLTSSSPAFVAAVDPDYVLYPVGYRNRYRFPRPPVLARYARRGARQFRVDEEGALRFVLGEPDGPRKEFSYRRASRRYWHAAGNRPQGLGE